MTRWREARLGPRSARLQADPYFEWAEATNFAYYGPGTWLPVLLELKDVTAKDFANLVFELKKKRKERQAAWLRVPWPLRCLLAGLRWLARILGIGKDGKADEDAWVEMLRIPVFYRAPLERLHKPTRHISGLATRTLLRQLYGGTDPTHVIGRFEVGRRVEPPGMEDPRPGGSAPHKPPAGNSPAVVIGVIDDGIAFAHERFRDGPASTRIHYFWDQVEPGPGDPPYGREICKHDTVVAGIDSLLANLALAEEDKLYRVSGFLDYAKPGHKPLAQRVAHGTHVMDLACDASVPYAPGAWPIVAVQLPTATVADTSGATLGPQIYNGLVYIIAMAQQIADAAKVKQLPVVVNVSYGTIAGPHDGLSELEVAMDELLDSCNPLDAEGKPLTTSFRVVLPAGNNHLSRCHACFPVKAKAVEELRWRVLPDDWTESYVELYLPDLDDSGNSAGLSISIAAPDGDATLAYSGGLPREFVIGGRCVGQASYWPAAAGGRHLVRLTLAPTGYPDHNIPLAPAGLWRITIDNTLGASQVSDIHAWIQRDDTPPGYRRSGRQSYFDHPDYQRYDGAGRLVEADNGSHVKRAMTLNAIATGKQPIVIGGFRRSDWRPAPYSASGPLLAPRGAPNDLGPDAMAVSEDTPSHRGVLAAGTRSGSCTAMHGTSVAAPQIARWVAGELAAGRPGDRQAVAQFAQTVVAPPVFTEKNPPAGAAPRPTLERGGAGRIEFPAMKPLPPARRSER